MNNLVEKLDLNSLMQFFGKQKNVASAFLFGSSQDGKVETESDIDIAVLFNSVPSAQEKLDLYSVLCDKSGINKPLDMTVLNESEPILAFEALSGKRINHNNPEKTAEFTSYTSRLYEDVMANIEYQYLLQKSR